MVKSTRDMILIDANTHYTMMLIYCECFQTSTIKLIPQFNSLNLEFFIRNYLFFLIVFLKKTYTLSQDPVAIRSFCISTQKTASLCELRVNIKSQLFISHTLA